jgi:hypothetical protein
MKAAHLARATEVLAAYRQTLRTRRLLEKCGSDQFVGVAMKVIRMKSYPEEIESCTLDYQNALSCLRALEASHLEELTQLGVSEVM